MDRNHVKTITLWLREAFGVRKNSNADSGDRRALLLKGKTSPGCASPTVPLTGTWLPQGSAILQGAFSQGVGRRAALRCPHRLDRKCRRRASAQEGISRRHNGCLRCGAAADHGGCADGPRAQGSGTACGVAWPRVHPAAQGWPRSRQEPPPWSGLSSYSWRKDDAGWSPRWVSLSCWK